MRTGGDAEGQRHTLSAHLLNCPFSEDRQLRRGQNLLFVLVTTACIKAMNTQQNYCNNFDKLTFSNSFLKQYCQKSLASAPNM